VLYIIKNIIKNQSSLTLKTLIIVPTILEISSYALAFIINFIYILKKKGFKAIVKAFRVFYLKKPLLLNKSF